MNISSYLSDLASRFSGAHSIPSDLVDRKVTYFDLQLMKPPGQGIYVLVGYVDGYQVYRESEEFFAVKSNEPVACLCLLPVRAGSGPRNLAVAYKSSPSVVRFVDMTTGETYHVIRLTAPVLGLKPNRVSLAIQLDGKVAFYDIDSLQDTFSVEVMSSSIGSSAPPALALGDRWVAYTLPPQIASPSSSMKPSPGVWNTITSLGQDAIDNIMLAVYKRDTVAPDSISSPRSSTPLKNARNGIVVIKDVVTQRIIGCVEDKDTNRPVEWLEWSPCGTFLVTAIANGHNCRVYRAGVDFELVCSLNRGVTPAVITSVSVSFDLEKIAICSAKGTVHVFDLTEKHKAVITATERIRTNGDNDATNPKILFDPTGELLVLNNTVVQRFKFSSGASGTTISDSRAIVKETPVDVLLSLPEPAPLAQATPVIQTCRPLEIPPWRSPLIAWRTHDGRRIDFSPGATTPIIDQSKLLSSLHTDFMPTTSSTKSVPAPYIPTSKDGFVQVI